ncbi:recombinase family protein [Streptomyces sp. NRRL S-1448]|uniref:recombinase family protein n=1 Tax=Streptomyces sp. NRRL S-1448 TaxID=1463883 RepID=UPI00068D6055|nr:recombinase family protein [Streptomyces sp. NRRL S-1448]
MLSSEYVNRQGSTTARRTEGDVRRRQALADAASGMSPGAIALPAKAAKIERFRCVIYLCGAPGDNLAELREECTEYAEAFCWGITAVIEDREGPSAPEGRDGLRQAIDLIKSGQAGAVVTAWRSMISPTVQEYDQVAREVERAGGFLHVMALTCGEDGNRRG